MSQQQTVLRVETNIVDFTITSGSTPPFIQIPQYKYLNLDLYGDIPIKINKSIAEIEDISKRNSDLSIGLSLPGSKNNNRFFETFYNVDTQTLYFDPTKRVNCDVLLNDQSYFKGYMRLNKINVIDSKVEYDVTLYSTVGNLFGQIGNNLLQDLDFDDTEYTFNHQFTTSGVTSLFGNSNFYKDSEYPYTYFYPIVHNGYEYSANTINFSGITSGQTRLYTSTSPIGSFPTYTAATSAGVEEYRINSPLYGLRDNQLKPALNVWSLIKLIFKTYGYSIKSDFMNTPWIKSLYLYGYFSYEGTKFGWKINNIQQLPLDGVELRTAYINPTTYLIVVCKLGTGIPCYCTEDINFQLICLPSPTPTATGPVPTSTPTPTPGGPTPTPSSTPTPTATPTPVPFGNKVIRAGTSGYTATDCALDILSSFDVPADKFKAPDYLPKNVGDSTQYQDGDYVAFDLVIDQNIKQIDLLSSIAKKFNLVFIPDPENPNQIIVEPYDYYIGTGQIFDWTPKLSWDKGFTVEPAQNFIESSLLLTDLEDGDEGNREFKNRVNRIYGRNLVYNPTDFKSQEKKIDTIFSPQLIRRWDDNIGLPLGINYSATSDIDKVDNQVRWSYKGVKTKPKLFYWVGTANPFIDDVNEVYSTTGTNYNTYTVKIAPSNYTGTSVDSYERIPVVSHTMPLGLRDNEKINNDSLSILFNSELPVDIGVQTYNTYTENDVYNTFYRTRINNIYNPNTRMISGYFDLKYSDIQNFQWNDVIKIREQYFTINKISEFNLTNRELTKVELIQLNLNPQEYVDRYFKYTYCDQPSYCFKLKTDFTNPNLQDTNFIWSTYYDQQVGSLTGTTTGFTSTFRIFNTGSFQEQYVPYTMQEISETDYVGGSCYNSSCDTMLNYIYANPNGLNYSLASFWENTAGTFTGTNLWSNCAGFNSTNSTYVITTGSSTTYGINSCAPTPTPTSTSTPTPTPTSTPTPPTPTATTPPPPTPTAAPLVCYQFNDMIYDTILDSQNRWIMVGSFTSYSGNTANKKIAFNTGLTINTTFDRFTGTPIGDVYNFINETSDGKFIIGAGTVSSGINPSRLPANITNFYKLTSGGTIDSSFSTITEIDSWANNSFVSKNRNIIWNVWNTLNIATVTSYISLYAMTGGTSINFQNVGRVRGSDVFDSDGSIIVTSESGIPNVYTRKFYLFPTGSTPTYFFEDTTFASNIYSNDLNFTQIKIDQVSNKFYGVGDVNGDIKRFNSDGTLDSSFSFTGKTISGYLYGIDSIIEIDNNQRLLILIRNRDSINDRYIIKLNTNGTEYTTFDMGGLPSQSLFYQKSVVLPDNSISFTSNTYIPPDTATLTYVNSYGTYLRDAMIIVNDDGTVESCPTFYYYSIRQYDCNNSCAVISPDLVGRSSTQFSTTSGTYYRFDGYSNVYQVQTEITPAPGSFDINMDTILDSSSVCGDACV